MKNIIYIALTITIASFNLTALADPTPTPGYSEQGPSKGTCRIIGRDAPCKRKFE